MSFITSRRVAVIPGVMTSSFDCAMQFEPRNYIAVCEEGMGYGWLGRYIGNGTQVVKRTN